MAKGIKKLGPKFKIGDRVMIKGIVDPGDKLQDSDLNGMTGKLVKKFAFIPYGQVGIKLDRQDKDGMYRANIFWRECKKLGALINK